MSGKTKSDSNPLVTRLQEMCDNLGVDLTLDPEVVSKGVTSHTSRQVGRLLTLCDPNAQRIRKGEILAQCELNSDPDVVAARTMSDISRTILQARALQQMGEKVVNEYTSARNVLKGSTSTDKKDKVAKGKAKSSKSAQKSTSTDQSVQ